MSEWKFFAEGEVPYVSTAHFHADRERAPHLEQWVHTGRLEKAYEFACRTINELPDMMVGVSDLGCGDGGLLSLFNNHPKVTAWGYDFQPSNSVGWVERGVKAEALDVFNADRDKARLGKIAICTEVLEHLADPHGVVKWVGETSRFIIASSPWTETDVSHDECHAWAWDMHGYRNLIEQGGFTVRLHEQVGMFQVILGEVVND